MISIYTDGSSHAKSGKPGGWAFVVVNDSGEVLGQGSGGDPVTSNNRMELTAAIKGIEWVLQNVLYKEHLIELVSDSQYCLGMANGSWNPSANHDLVEQIQQLYVDAKIWRTRWVAGHNGDKFNEECDKLAKTQKEIQKELIKAQTAPGK